MDPNLIQTIAGAGAGLVSALLVNPLDIVKLRLQNDFKNHISTATMFKSILKSQGVKGLFVGINATASAYIVDRSIWFPVYAWCKNQQWRQDQSSFWIHLNSCIFASFAAVVFVNPLWLVRTRIMTQSSVKTSESPYYYHSVWDGIKSIVKKEGWSSLYKGLGPSLLGITHVAVQFPLYEHLKSILKTKEKKKLSNQDILFASSFSKMVASVTTYPHEVIRTRLQTQVAHSNLIHKAKYQSLLQASSVIYREEGVLGFYKGLFTNLLRTVPASALSLLIYEILVYELQQL